jgi:hypothetical protein
MLRTGAKRRSLSDLLDEIVTSARLAAHGDSIRSVVGTVDIPLDDPGLERADALLRAEFEASLARPLLLHEDKSVYGGRFYSNKAPGLSLAAAPVYAAVRVFTGPARPGNATTVFYLVRLLTAAEKRDAVVYVPMAVVRKSRCWPAGSGEPAPAGAVVLRGLVQQPAYQIHPWIRHRSSTAAICARSTTRSTP